MHVHEQIGDPGAEPRLWAAVGFLLTALDAGAADQFAARAADGLRVAAELAADESPRTRAQARGLRTAAELIIAGRPEEARALLEGELTRSFPGRGDLDLARRYLG